MRIRVHEQHRCSEQNSPLIPSDPEPHGLARAQG